MKETEGIFDDSVIFVTTQGSVIGIDGGRITVAKKGEGELASFPIGKVDTINVFGGLTSPRHLSQAQMNTASCSTISQRTAPTAEVSFPR